MKPKKERAKSDLARNETEDFYFENGRMVFTEDFLRRRGVCCQCGCRHCPYGFGPEGLRRKLEAEKAGL